jgi:opacity protein-like surface antigen
VLLLMASASSAMAGTAAGWSTAGAYVQDVGNNGLFGPGYAGNPTQTDDDKVTLSSDSDTLTLTLGTPQTVEINPLTFEVGQTGYEGTDESYSLVTDFSMTENLTVNGITEPLVINMTHDSGWNTDSLQVLGGPSVAFGNIIVTPLAWSAADVNGGGDSFDTVEAQFAVTPEPISMIFFGTGLVAIGGYVSRKRMLRKA